MRADSAKGVRSAMIAAAYIAAYVALDWISYLYPVAPFAITPWNPPPGLSLALLLGLGLRYAPALFVAAWLADIVVRDAPWLSALVVAGVLASGYSGVAAFLVRATGFDARLRSVKDLALFAASAAAGSVVVATSYVAILGAEGRIAWPDLPRHIPLFWVGDFVGIVVTTPFLLACGAALRDRAYRGLGWSSALEALSIPLVLGIIFGLPQLDPARHFYLLFVPLVWIGARHGLPGAAAALFAIQAGLIAAAKLAGYTASSVYELQFLMTALAVTALFLGSAVSERRAAQDALREREQQLDHALRIAAGSELASALAHELNQPLSAASNYARASVLMLKQPNADSTRLTEALGRALSEMDRAAEVVRRLREFFRSGASRSETVELSALVRAAQEALRSRLDRHGISLAVAVLRQVPPVSVDRLQIELVLRNLIGNAIDAMRSAEQRAGSIAIEIDAQDERFAKVTVRDSGPGVSPEIARRLFDPFNTSKPQGLGLGLAISRSIVEAHGGSLWSERQPAGAAFSFTLPLAETPTARP